MSSPCTVIGQSSGRHFLSLISHVFFFCDLIGPFNGRHFNVTQFWQGLYMQEYVTRGIFSCDFYLKLRRARGSNNFIFTGTKIVKRLRRRQYDHGIIEKTISYAFGPYIVTFLQPWTENCTLTNKLAGTTWRTLSKPPQRRQGPEPCPFRLLIVGNPAPRTLLRLQIGQSKTCSCRCHLFFLYIFLILFCDIFKIILFGDLHLYIFSKL